jgi:hypothetical protein
MPLSLADLFKYHADKSVRIAYARNDDQEDRESRLKMAQRWIEAAAVLQAQRVQQRRTSNEASKRRTPPRTAHRAR